MATQKSGTSANRTASNSQSGSDGQTTMAAALTAAGANTTSQGASSQGQDAVTLLKNDHREVLDAFKRFQSEESDATKQQLVEKICTDLIIHTKLEEEIFYPACREASKTSDKLDEAQVEHDTTKVLIHELQSLSMNSAYYDAKVKVLGELVKHHIAEEEKSGDGIFAQAQAGGVDLKELGKRLQSRKEQLMASGKTQQISLDDFEAIEFDFASTPSYSKETQAMASQYENRQQGGRNSNRRERDEYGRFMSEDDDRGYGRGSEQRYGRDSDRDEYESDYGRQSRRGSSERERDEYGRFVSDDDYGRYSSRDDSRDDDRRYGSSRGGGEGRGWFGDSEGHSRAAQSRWDERGSSRSRDRDYEDDDRRYGSRSGGESRGGYYGSDDYGRGEDRSDYRGSRSSGRDEEDDDRGNGSRGRGHGGWFGDPRGHAKAARRGWQNR